MLTGLLSPSAADLPGQLGCICPQFPAARAAPTCCCLQGSSRVKAVCTCALQKAMAARLNPGVAAAAPMQRMGGGGGAMPAEPRPGFSAARGMPEPGYSNSPLHMPAQVPPPPLLLLLLLLLLLRLFELHPCARPSPTPSLPAACPCPPGGTSKCRGTHVPAAAVPACHAPRCHALPSAQLASSLPACPVLPLSGVTA